MSGREIMPVHRNATRGRPGCRVRWGTVAGSVAAGKPALPKWRGSRSRPLSIRENRAQSTPR